jgi:hypothetical protein
VTRRGTMSLKVDKSCSEYADGGTENTIALCSGKYFMIMTIC